ncbi:HTH-type transcriptional regulator gltC [Delftia tsuruhatensis]|uniref:LysR family transcriptional regulator n=1 Tax=Delftia tsuruhatensis TaxID=180282 RepID=UPI001E78C47C|nr:LysR family transcriptional regulator [Delftia tsuruhatensis]CAB5702626.1 HTH-type transcriptional regulator gltC [Delftia tsuruhatensis]CAC9691147.1 HTH-type transcriptional regulator gltC [Delftia tsuruhatensis]
MHARVLRYLDEVVRRGSIRKAAEYLHVAPTAVNRQILDLEAELGAPLFERIHNRLRLTPLGEMVLAHVRATLREHAALRERIAELQGARSGEITVAATTGLAGSLLPSLVHEFRQRHPGIAVRVIDLPVAGIAAAVEGGDADLGLAYDLPERPALRALATSEWQIGAIVPPRHALARQSSVLLSECVGHPLILPAPPLSIRSLLDEAFARNAIEVTPVAESTSMALIQRLVMLGEGIALLNPLDVMEERSRNALVFVPLRDAHLQRQTLVLAARARGQLSAAGELMAQSICEALARLFAMGR